MLVSIKRLPLAEIDRDVSYYVPTSRSPKIETTEDGTLKITDTNKLGVEFTLVFGLSELDRFNAAIDVLVAQKARHAMIEPAVDEWEDVEVPF